MYRTKDRILAGRYADSKANPEADCFILESLIRRLEEDARTKRDQLLYCTENLKDFGVQLDERRNAVHPLMKEGLPPTDLFTDLKSLLNFLKDHEEVKEPAPEEVNEAIEREKTHEIEKKDRNGACSVRGIQSERCYQHVGTTGGNAVGGNEQGVDDSRNVRDSEGDGGIGGAEQGVDDSRYVRDSEGDGGGRGIAQGN